MKRRSPIRYVRIQADPRPPRARASASRSMRINMSALARAIIRALLPVR